MFKQKKQESKQEEELIPECPICNSFVQQQYFLEDKGTNRKSRWFHCACGVVFQKSKPDGKYNAEYLKKFADNPKYSDSARYPVKIYSPLIEELIYGRKVLVVGTPTFDQVEEFRARGWVTYSIDKNEAIPASPRHFVGDFETYEFPKDLSFNLIWVYGVLECFNDPQTAIKNCFTLMPEDGILFIGVPDTDFVFTRSSSAFKNWRPEYHNIMWNRRSLTSLLEKLGFQTILAWSNPFERFVHTDDLQLIAQKKYF